MRNVFIIYMCLYLIISNKDIRASDEVKANKKIIIIGAGAAGIAAASKLFENGFRNILILEAENRIGGRVYTTKIGDYSVDIGGQWIHGQKDNVAFNLANPLGLVDADDETIIYQKLFDSSGTRLSDSIDKNLESFFSKYYVQAGAPQVKTSALSSGEFIEKSYNEEFKDQPEMMNLRNEILHYLEVLQLSDDSADSWKDISTSDTKEYIVREGDQDVAWKTKGYGTILDILMKRYPDPQKELPVVNNTRLNTEVTLINYTKGHPVLVFTKDNQKLEADHVIVTVSLGVLKAQHDSLFIPPLPSKKITAIETLGFGSAGKIYLYFEEPFLESVEHVNMTNFGFLWNDADKKMIENDPEKMWMLGVTGAWLVEHKPKLVEIYIASKWATAMEKVDEHKVFDQILELLERFMGKTYQIPKPIFIMRTQWHSNSHFRGTYSYRNVESEIHHIFPQMLQESITPENHRLLFAGEATSPHRFSTVDGAIESGWTAADNLINLYKTT